MENNQLQLVTNEQAQRLKKLGFHWKCSTMYSDERLSKSFYGNHNNWDDDDLASAPTVALALKWFRDVKEKFGVLGIDECIDTVRFYNMVGSEESKHFDTYDAAESALLDGLLTIIEKQEIELFDHVTIPAWVDGLGEDRAGTVTEIKTFMDTLFFTVRYEKPDSLGRMGIVVRENQIEKQL